MARTCKTCAPRWRVGAVKAVYVLDPGPDGALGDMSWLSAARRSGALALLVVQGVVMNELAAAADVVLPGAAYVERMPSTPTTRAMSRRPRRQSHHPERARDDWQILVTLARALGLAMPYESSDDVRRALAAALPGTAYANADRLAFARPVPASNWLQASNPSERWKWDFLFQDLPPVKGHNVQTEGLSPRDAFIPLKPVG